MFHKSVGQLVACCIIWYCGKGRDARTISINVQSYLFLVYQLELTKTEMLSPHLQKSDQ